MGLNCYFSVFELWFILRASASEVAPGSSILFDLRLRDTVWVCPHSKHNNSQCSLAPDYGYKRWSTNREAPRACMQQEGIGYLVGTVSCGRLNFMNSKSDQMSNQK